MIPIQGRIRVFVGLQSVDMRKSFDGLCAEVKRQIRMDPADGHLYAFIGNNRRRMKLLLFDRHGFWIFYRRLERGSFQLPTGVPGSTRLEIDAATLAAILDGVDLDSMRRRMRYRRPDPAS